jgi:hypothetical protein
VGDIAIPYLFAVMMALEYGYNAVRRNGTRRRATRP